MPAVSTTIGLSAASQLLMLGEALRDRRKALGVNAVTAAEAAGMSRVTLHRIENGEPSVTMGAYMEVAQSLGLRLALTDPSAVPPAPPPLPDRLRLDDFPQLKNIAWHMPEGEEVTPLQALELYERHWRHVEKAKLNASERALIKALATQVGGGRLLV